jgi:hypothetical protein
VGEIDFKLTTTKKFLGPAADSCYIRVEVISSTRPLGRVFVFLGYDPSADGREATGIGRSVHRCIGSRKDHAWATRGSNGESGFVCNKRRKKAGWGGKNREIWTSGHREIGKMKNLSMMNTDDTDRKNRRKVIEEKFRSDGNKRRKMEERICRDRKRT